MIGKSSQTTLAKDILASRPTVFPKNHVTTPKSHCTKEAYRQTITQLSPQRYEDNSNRRTNLPSPSSYHLPNPFILLYCTSLQ